MITQRQKYILNLVVKNYLERGKASSSFNLKKTYRLPFSSPTIRNELKALEEMQLLEKPFFSSGRLPTITALEYYLKNFIYARWRVFKDTSEVLSLKEQFNLLVHKFRDIQDLVRDIANIIETTTIAFNEEQYELGGLRYIPRMFQLEYSKIDLSKNIMKFLECLDNDDFIRQKLNVLLEHDLPYIALGQKLALSHGFNCTITLSQMALNKTKLNFAFIGGRRFNYRRAYVLAKIINKAKLLKDL